MTGGSSLTGSFPTPRNGILSVDYEFIETAKEKLNIYQADLEGTTYEFLKDFITIDIEKEFGKLPYRFVDVQNLDNKVDPKKLQLGSKSIPEIRSSKV